MKLWIRHENRYGEVRVSNYIAVLTKERAIELANVHNKYLAFDEYPALDIQEIEIDSDIMIYGLLIAYGLDDWKRSFFIKIEKQDASIKFGETIEIEQVNPVILT